MLNCRDQLKTSDMKTPNQMCHAFFFLKPITGTSLIDCEVELLWKMSLQSYKVKSRYCTQKIHEKQPLLITIKPCVHYLTSQRILIKALPTWIIYCQCFDWIYFYQPVAKHLCYRCLQNLENVTTQFPPLHSVTFTYNIVKQHGDRTPTFSTAEQRPLNQYATDTTDMTTNQAQALGSSWVVQRVAHGAGRSWGIPLAGSRLRAWKRQIIVYGEIRIEIESSKLDSDLCRLAYGDVVILSWLSGSVTSESTSLMACCCMALCRCASRASACWKKNVCKKYKKTDFVLPSILYLEN